MTNDPYETQFKEAGEKARENWIPTTGSATAGVVHVAAEAKTGSRYAVVVSALPGMGADAEGGRWLVSVLHPWQTCYVVSHLDGLHFDYIWEKFMRPGEVPSVRRIHGGDAIAVAMTINYALTHFATWTEEERTDPTPKGLGRNAGPYVG